MREAVTKVINAASKRVPGEGAGKNQLAVQVDDPMFRREVSHEQGSFKQGFYYSCIYEEAKTKAGARIDLEEAVKKQRVKTTGTVEFEDLVFHFPTGKAGANARASETKKAGCLAPISFDLFNEFKQSVDAAITTDGMPALEMAMAPPASSNMPSLLNVASSQSPAAAGKSCALQILPAGMALQEKHLALVEERVDEVVKASRCIEKVIEANMKLPQLSGHPRLQAA